MSKHLKYTYQVKDKLIDNWRHFVLESDHSDLQIPILSVLDKVYAHFKDDVIALAKKIGVGMVEKASDDGGYPKPIVVRMEEMN